MPKYFLGIDGGGTHSRARLTNEDGEVLGEGEAGPANSALGAAVVREALLDAAMQAVGDAGLARSQMQNIHAAVGIAGVSRVSVVGAVKSSGLPFQSLAFESDAAIAQIGAFAGGDGGIVNVGTGSVACIRIRGQTILLGGYGLPLSNEGSGSWIGLQALRHTLLVADGRADESELAKRLSSEFSTERRAVIKWMDEARASDYAKWAPIVTELALVNEPKAIEIMDEAAQMVAAFIQAVFKKGAPECALVGGLAKALSSRLPQPVYDSLSTPRGDSLDGALRLARTGDAGDMFPSIGTARGPF